MGLANLGSTALGTHGSVGCSVVLLPPSDVPGHFSQAWELHDRISKAAKDGVKSKFSKERRKTCDQFLDALFQALDCQKLLQLDRDVTGLSVTILANTSVFVGKFI